MTPPRALKQGVCPALPELAEATESELRPSLRPAPAAPLPFLGACPGDELMAPLAPEKGGGWASPAARHSVTGFALLAAVFLLMDERERNIAEAGRKRSPQLGRFWHVLWRLMLV